MRGECGFGRFWGGGSELPDAFGVGVARAQVVEAEEGEVCEGQQKAENGDDKEQGGQEQRCEQLEGGSQWTERSSDVTEVRETRLWERQSIVNDLN